MLALLPRLVAPARPRPRIEPAPAERPGGALRLVTLNLAHGRSRSAHQAFLKRSTVEANLAEVARLLRRTRPDLVALQEADGPSAWSGNFDHVETLLDATDLAEGFRGDHNPFRLGRLELNSGTALLARVPLSETRSHRFGLSWRDTKGFVWATLAVPTWDGLEVDAVSVHLDFLLPRTRSRQVRDLAAALERRPEGRPLVVSGDMNCCWDHDREPLEHLARRLDLTLYQPDVACPTFPAARPFRRLDWILISRELQFLSHETLDVPLSDHLGVLADLALR